MTDYKHLIKLKDEANALPWKYDKQTCSVMLDIPQGFQRIARVANAPWCHADAAYIVAACNAVPELVEEIERLRKPG